MKKFSKRITKLRALIRKKSYPFEEGIRLLKELKSAKFLESTEVHISLNIDPKYANQQLRNTLILPHGIGKSLRIGVLTEPENVKNVLELGAAVAGYEDLLEDIAKGKLDFDILLTTPQLMPKLAKLGKILGPKSLMPSPKSGTVTQNLPQAISEFAKGKLEYRADKSGIVHLTFGKADFSEKQLSENLIAIYSSIQENRPSGVKGRYFNSLYICTTMSPSIKVDLGTIK
jgi:large subunit ribosomal protein L1